MADVSEVYRIISQEKARLDNEYPQGYLFTTSVRNINRGTTAGVVAQVNTKRAAQTIVDGTHRESTREEIESFKRRGELFAAKMQAAEVRRNPALGQTIILPGGSK
jgi:hypothetical protein